MTRPRTTALAALLALAAAVPAAAQEAAPAREGQRIDDRRPDAPITFGVFGRPVEFTGSWEFSLEKRQDFDLDPARPRDRRVRENELKLELRARPGTDTEVFLQGSGLHEVRHTQGADSTREGQFERGQTWVRFGRLFDSAWSLQLGRVALLERRGWWWDDDRDALRLQYGGDTWRLDSGVGRELAKVSSKADGIDPAEQDVTRWWGQGTWRWARRQAVDLFWLVQRDRSGAPAAGRVFTDEDAADGSDLDARWLGARVGGELRFESGWRFAYRFDAATLAGREVVTSFDEGADGRITAAASTQRRLRSHAFDLEATVVAPGAGRPSLTLAQAVGSGGSSAGGVDRAFRQTGLQENKGRIAGVKRVRLYGELLQPTLSNLQVSLLAGGVRLAENTSLEVMARRYRQKVASGTIAGSRLATDPEGLNGDIGNEIDLVLALREWRHAEVALRAARFEPGAAFAPDRRAPAQSIEIEFALNF